MAYLVGKIALDVDAGAPNNGRADESTVGNITRVKQMRIGREIYPYVSAQAFRRWWRDSLPAAEKRSPVVRSGAGKKQQAHTTGRPDRYLDDDLFGYMVALKGASTQRDTVVATGTLVSITPQRPTEDFGTMSRGFAAGENPVLHEHEFYSAELAADVLIDLPRVGVFEVDGSGLKVALGADAVAEAKAAGAQEAQLRGVAALRLSIEAAAGRGRAAYTRGDPGRGQAVSALR
jgi:CRISPR-associated protein Cas7/Cst2/DevR subtype I-B